MSPILFLIILAVLIFVHELGHFLIAKLSNIRVDEFALGFPPTLAKKQVGETVYKLNIIPFGGYVSIFGENPDDESLNGPQAKDRSMARKPRHIQAAVLAAGVVFNIIFAWLLISISLGLGISPIAPAANNPAFEQEGKIIISSVTDGSPAKESGLIPGDIVYSAVSEDASLSEESLDIAPVQELIASADKVTFGIYRGDDDLSIVVVPREGIVAGKKAIGISMESTALVKVPWHRALIEGAKTTYGVTILTAKGLGDFVGQAFRGNADYGQVSGPIGIIGMVDEASHSGFSYLLFFTAIISINLAIINILPFPALDGGRLVFILIESITRRQINPKVANALNTAGFALLIFLMVVITYHDIAKMFV